MKRITKKKVIEYLRERGRKAVSSGVQFHWNEQLEIDSATVYLAHHQRVVVKIRDGEPVSITAT